jgi:hypothetical protein
MGSRAKNNPPRRRGPKPETMVPPAKWIGPSPKGLAKSKESWPKGASGGKKRKGRGK